MKKLVPVLSIVWANRRFLFSVKIVPVLLTVAALISGCGSLSSSDSTSTAASTATEDSVKVVSTAIESTIFTGMQPGPQFGIVIDASLQVVDIEKGGAAEKATIQRGDILKELDGTPLISALQARETAIDAMLKKAASGQQLSLKLLRNGQLLDVSILPTPPADRGGTAEHPVPPVTPVWEPYQYF